MKLSVQTFYGKEAQPYLPDLARLRIEVFREYPYLYDGSVAYEKEYLEHYLESTESIIVVAFADEQVVGVSTGMPLSHAAPEIQQPWLEGDHIVEQIFYFGESVLRKDYRGRGLGVQFFAERENWARHRGYQFATFCGVIREADHPARPTRYVPLDSFWKKRGYEKKEGCRCRISWKEIHETKENEKELQFWLKEL